MGLDRSGVGGALLMVAVMATVVVAVVARNVNWNRIKSALPVVVAASSMGLRLSGELSGNRDNGDSVRGEVFHTKLVMNFVTPDSISLALCHWWRVMISFC